MFIFTFLNLSGFPRNAFKERKRKTEREREKGRKGEKYGVGEDRRLIGGKGCSWSAARGVGGGGGGGGKFAQGWLGK